MAYNGSPIHAVLRKRHLINFTTGYFCRARSIGEATGQLGVRFVAFNVHNRNRYLDSLLSPSERAIGLLCEVWFAFGDGISVLTVSKCLQYGLINRSRTNTPPRPLKEAGNGTLTHTLSTKRAAVETINEKTAYFFQDQMAISATKLHKPSMPRAIGIHKGTSG
jgi:hypothetical protein